MKCLWWSSIDNRNVCVVFGDDVDGDRKAFNWELSMHLIGKAWWSQTHFDCTIWGREGKPWCFFGRVSNSVVIKWNLSLSFVQMEGVGDDGGVRVQTKQPQKPPWLDFMPLPQPPPVTGCRCGSNRRLGHSRPLLYIVVVWSCLHFYVSFPKNKKLIVSMYVCECGCTFLFLIFTFFQRDCLL